MKHNILLCFHLPGLVRHFRITASVTYHRTVFTGRHSCLNITVGSLRTYEGCHIIADVVHQDGIGLEHVTQCVIVHKVQLYIRQDTGAVVNLFNCILYGTRYC